MVEPGTRTAQTGVPHGETPRGETLHGGASGLSTERIRLGVITAPHGVRGLVRIKSFTDNPTDLCAYGPLTDEAGNKPFSLEIVGESRGALLARIDGVADRSAAEQHRGAALCIARDALPDLADGDEYYHTDLIGLAALDTEGETLGTVRAVHNHGAGDVLEIAREDGGDMLIPFTRTAVPSVDLATGVTVIPPISIVPASGDADADDGEVRDGGADAAAEKLQAAVR